MGSPSQLICTDNKSLNESALLSYSARKISHTQQLSFHSTSGLSIAIGFTHVVRNPVSGATGVHML